MKITCLDKQVGQLLKESFYRIPRFQRPYSWDRTNIEEFWNDAVVESEAQYFIGNFVVYDDKTAMGVVDGQQRLTTTAITSQRSSGGISFMYALAARELYQARNLSAKVKGLQDFQKNKLAAKQPQYAEFEAGFMELKYSSQMTKQKNLVRYVLTRIYQKNSTGLPIDPEQATIEHLAPENPAKNTGVSDEQVASIGNLILVNQALNNELANKTFKEKVAILKNAHVWVDPVILDAKSWEAAEIERRTKLLAQDAYNNVWSL